MKNIYKSAFALLALAMIGCGGDDDNNTVPVIPVAGNCNTNIPFFQTGKFAKYYLSQFGSDAGTMNLTYGACGGTGLLSPMEFRNTSNVVTQTVQNRMWQDGVWLVNDAKNDGIDPLKLYKIDAQLNDSWTETNVEGDVITHTVVDVDSLITVPAGSFHCKVYLYQKSDIANDSYIFWNDQYGQIMEDAGFFKIEMMDYN